MLCELQRLWSPGQYCELKAGKVVRKAKVGDQQIQAPAAKAAATPSHKR